MILSALEDMQSEKEMNKVFSIWCEYDIGLDYCVFTSTEKAEIAAEQAIASQEWDEPTDYATLQAEGLIGINTLSLE